VSSLLWLIELVRRRFEAPFWLYARGFDIIGRQLTPELFNYRSKSRVYHMNRSKPGRSGVKP
jgi:hypothetical protein